LASGERWILHGEPFAFKGCITLYDELAKEKGTTTTLELMLPKSVGMGSRFLLS